MSREKVRRLRGQNPEMKAAEIARKLGLSKQRVGQILATEGLPTRIFPVADKSAAGIRREYKCWWAMLDRCYNPDSPDYRYYGARGIDVCARWRSSFKAFFEDMGPKPSELTIERVNNDRGYSPSNCIWADRSTQNRNQRRGKRGKYAKKK